MAKKARKKIESEDNKCLDWACVGRLKDIVEAVNGKFSASLPFYFPQVTCHRTWLSRVDAAAQHGQILPRPPTCAYTRMDEASPPPPPEDHSPPPQPPSTGSPTEFLKNVVGKRVIVRLNSGVDYRGARSVIIWSEH